MRDAAADKDVDRELYDSRAKAELEGGVLAAVGSSSVEPLHRAPYLFYEASIRALGGPGKRALELGAGTGRHTRVLLETGADVCATDISPTSLEVLRRRLADEAAGRLTTEVADIEALPFADGRFDLVACAGSLSYGDPALVDRELLRVLKPGGSVVFVDTLNHNLVYRANRFLNYLRGRRTRSTIERMPTIPRIEGLASHFEKSDLRCFGGFLWLMSLPHMLLGDRRAAALSDALDRALHVRASAFKFVLVATGKRR